MINITNFIALTDGSAPVSDQSKIITIVNYNVVLTVNCLKYDTQTVVIYNPSAFIRLATDYSQIVTLTSLQQFALLMLGLT